MAAEALRRLREEINAAFEDQRRPSSEHRHGEVSCESLNPKWAQVTALLASVGRPAPKKTTFAGPKRISAPLKPVGGSCAHDRLHQLTGAAKHTLLRRYMLGWRRVAHDAAVVTRLHVRARRRRQLRLAANVLMAWRSRSRYQSITRNAAASVEKVVNLRRLETMWGMWQSARRRAATLGAFAEKRRYRLSYEAFCTWVLAANQRARYRRYEQKAARQLLRRFWRWFEAGIEAQRLLTREVEYLAECRALRLLERCIVVWVAFVEQRKRWLFARRWSDRRELGTAYDCWREVHERRRRVRHALQLCTRRRRRRLFRVVLRVWSSQAHRARARKQALVAALYSQQRRDALTQLMLHARLDRERELSLQNWRMHRTVWTWLHRAHRHRMLRLRMAFLKESHGRLVLRTGVWRPWRRAYVRSVKLRTFASSRRLDLLRKTWLAFVAALVQEEQRRLLVESMIDTREVRVLHQVVAAWRVRVRSTLELKQVLARSTTFYRRGLLQKTLSSWRAAHHVTLRGKWLDALATQHLTSKMVQHWARWARWSKRELTERIADMSKRRRQRQMQRCIRHWEHMVLARHQVVCAQAFGNWKATTERQQRGRHLLDLQRVIQLRFRWQRWGSFVSCCHERRTLASKAGKLREQRLLRYCLVTVWLHKFRSYSLGANLLAALSRRVVRRRTLHRWRENHQRRRLVRAADFFRAKSVRLRCLRLLFNLTVGYRRRAIAYSRRGWLRRTWKTWEQYFKRRCRRREADTYFRRRGIQKAVRLWHAAASKAIAYRNQRVDAEAWHEAVVVQRILSRWLASANHARRCRSLGCRLAWEVTGRRTFRVWQDALIERQQLLKAAQFHSSVLVTRSWNALLRVTKRRQVALAMWSHAMARIRLAHVLMNWKKDVTRRRGQHVVAASMFRMQEQRVQQRLFRAWALLAAAHRMSLRREQRGSRSWRQRCWAHWKLWRVSSRWQHSRQRELLRKLFHLGLKRHAIQQQACREVCVRTARSLLHRSLALWRIELWLARNQKRLTAEAKRKALSHWKAYTADCRQKRRWEHYVQQLHRSQTRSKAVTGNGRRPVGGTFRDTRALQVQLKRNRVLMTHVLGAWYLVVQNRRRRAQTRSSISRRREAAEAPRSSSKSKLIALEFWSRGVMRKCLGAWRDAAVGTWRRAERA
jgi:hypothetical protein